MDDELSVKARKAHAKALAVGVVMDAVAELDRLARASGPTWPYTTDLEKMADKLRELVA